MLPQRLAVRWRALADGEGSSVRTDMVRQATRTNEQRRAKNLPRAPDEKRGAPGDYRRVKGGKLLIAIGNGATVLRDPQSNRRGWLEHDGQG